MEQSRDIAEAEIREELRGGIGHVSAGILTGWAASSGSDKPLIVSVMCNGRLVGTGTADRYRKDLERAEIHKGFHGFSIELDDIFNDKDELHFSLCHAETLQPIRHAEFSVSTKESDVHLGSVRYSHGQVKTALHSTSSLRDVSLLVYSGDLLISTYTVSEDVKSESITINLPSPLLDGSEKLLRFGLKDFPNILGLEIIKCEPIKTLWGWLDESYRNPGFLSLPKQADSRYETLEYHIEALSQNRDLLTIQEVHKLHNILLGSYENRKVFEPFNLPLMSNPKVTIVIPAHNKFELTYHCLASVAFSYNKTSYEVLLVDDCSSDKTSHAQDLIGNLQVARNKENLGFLRSVNSASKLAQGEYLVLLNNDTEVTSFWLDELVAVLENDPLCGMAGAKLLNRNGSLQEAGGIIWGNGEPANVGRDSNPAAPEFNYVRNADYLSGAAVCIRNAVWKQVGGFSEEYAPCYFEDTDLAFKVRQADYRTIYTPFSQVVHFEGQSHGTDITKGLKKYQAINQKTFGENWIRSFRDNGVPSNANMMIEKDRDIGYRVLVLDAHTPRPNWEAGAYAAVQEMKILQALGCKITFAPEYMPHCGDSTAMLQRMGIEVLYAPFYSSISDVLKRRLAEMDAVYITRYSVAEKYIDMIRENSTARIIFNNADLHFLREIRSALSKSGDKDKLDKALITKDAELAVCGKSDAVLSYTSTEHAVITSHILEADKLHITPWVMETKTGGRPFQEREGIAFLGSFGHLPNLEAVEYLLNEIMPLLLTVNPDITLSVYGSNMPEEFSKHQSDNVQMVGFVENLDEIYHKHRIFVAPLISGAGIKGKVLEAMAYGVPCVVSEFAVEGTGLTNGVSTLIAEDPHEWVNAIAQLYNDEALWNRFVENERIIATENYSFEHGVAAFRKILASTGLYC
ncbi:N-acetylglucosaminyl-diphospho-decaprenol L-rhamnosyltransferase [Halioglobus japonicus]|nr:N-acetylglucosaminyl-diphospho-decaprenol L-rhamnosyltransferase [Halioglobus japonicus]